MHTSENTLWVLAGSAVAERNSDWLRTERITIPSESVDRAHLYGPNIEDRELIEMQQTQRPQHVVTTIGGGARKRLGPFLKHHFDYLVPIRCTGAAVAFLRGDQVRIPFWADKLCLGWFLRCLSSPRRYIPQYLSAPQLIPLIWRYHDQFLEPQDNQRPLSQAA